MDLEDPRTIGARLCQIRNSRRKSLRVVAGLSGMSKSRLSQIERGEVALDSLSEIVALADALQIAPSELIRLPMSIPAIGRTDSTTEAVRRALTEVEHGRPAGQVFPAEVLRDRVATMRQMPRRFADVGAALPSLIGDLHASINAGRDVPELLSLAVVVHVQVTHMWLRLAGASTDLRRDAARLARQAAQESGDVAALGVAAYGTVYALVGSGMFDLAQAELDSLTLPPTTPDTAGLVGSLAITHAYLAALTKRFGDVDGAMQTADELAQQFGEATADDVFGFAFGPTDVGLYRMALALEDRDPDRALSVAEGMHPERHPHSSRQASYWVDCGRALARLRRRHDDAVMAFWRAEKISPHHVHRNPMVREVIGELLVRSRRDAVGRELRGLAYRSGLSV